LEGKLDEKAMTKIGANVTLADTVKSNWELLVDTYGISVRMETHKFVKFVP
jgi:hypothetical protein